MNTPAYIALSVQQFLNKNGVTPMPHPPYSPDLTPSDFLLLLFPWMKKVLKGKHFTNVKEVKQKTSEVLKGIKINEFKTALSSEKTSP